MKKNTSIPASKAAKNNLPVNGWHQDSLHGRQPDEEALQKYRTLFNSMTEGFIICELIYNEQNKAIDWRWLEVNPAFEKQVDLKSEAIVGQRRTELFPNMDYALLEKYTQVVQTQQSIEFEEHSKAADKWLYIRAIPFGQHQFAVLFSDITERKQLEQRQQFLLKLSDALSNEVDPLRVQAIASRLLGQHLNVNQVHYGETIDDVVVIHQGWENGLPPMAGTFRHQDFTKRIIESYRTGQIQVTNDIHTVAEPPFQDRDAISGAGFNAYIAIPIIKNGECVATFAVYSISRRKWKQDEVDLVKETAERTWDAVERARAIAALREAELQTKVKQLEEEQQREIFRVSLQTLEDERQRMAESLHNGLGQVLYGIKINLANLSQKQTEADFRKSKNYINLLLTDAIRESRRISHDLMPATLEEFGLASAVQDICDQLHGSVHFTCRVEIKGKRLAKYLELAVYRTVQELMTNIVKHAKAKNAVVDIYIDNKNIHIKVTDDGIGLNTAQKDKPGIGLTSIRSKIGLLSGNIAIESANGTAITINIPMSAKGSHKPQ